ncbi:chemotaxis protein MotD [Sinorhizobium kostiense]|uniref:Chemotaxis protein MotD n=1 Tax=Sinorhizobium kostiense TaxID=76747 RepID=A0ABS4QYA6_9HYPH|nr:flagellar hook-length control protein FliK [Sinorhizobium kostiense]MBP2235629.1 chemotaxis protein MotD [Sinorhizobium kostiense]
MNPLEQTLRAPASPGKSDARQGAKDQPAGEPGAFESAVADAGRQKTQGQGATAGKAGELAGIGQADVGSRGAGLVIASDELEASSRFSAAFQQAPSAQEHSSLAVDDRQNVTRLPQMAGKAKPSGREAAEHRAHAPGAKAKDDRNGQMLEHATAAGEAVGEETWGAGSRGSAEATGGAHGNDGTYAPPDPAGPTKEAVSDLLTLLAGPAPGRMPAEGKAVRASSDGVATQQSATVAGSTSAELATSDEVQSGKQPDEAASERLFRFARADGTGQAVSMSISRDGERVVESGVSSAAARAETVTVLEARRYLGVAMNANSASVAGAIAGDGEWALALQSSSLTQPETWNQAGKVLNTLKIQMHPIELGTVTATLRLKDEELHVELKVETGEAFRQLRDDQSEMVKALRAQGFAVDQVNVTFNGGSDASSGGGSQAQSQPGQPGRERAGDGGSQGHQRQDGGRVEMAEGWTGNDGTDEASIGAERARTGGVYM